MPFTRTWPAFDTGNNGAGGEGGVVTAGPVMLLMHNSGCPIDLTRSVIEGGRKVAVRHGVGPGPAGGAIDIGQPATTNGGADIGTGVPMIFTRGLGAVGLACPPCAQVTVQVIVNKNPGMSRHLQCAVVDVRAGAGHRN